MNNSSKKDHLIDKTTPILRKRKLSYCFAQDEKSINLSFNLSENQPSRETSVIK
jgi:hypothetical protein